MEIVRLVVQDGVDLTINGRLDSYWAEHLDHSLAEAVREGHDRLRLDLSRVTFLSSAGIAVLMKYPEPLRAIDGELVVFSPSQQVRTVLDMTRLTVHLVEAVDRTAARAARRQRALPSNAKARDSRYSISCQERCCAAAPSRRRSQGRRCAARIRCLPSASVRSAPASPSVASDSASFSHWRERLCTCLGTARTCRTISSRPGGRARSAGAARPHRRR